MKCNNSGAAAHGDDFGSTPGREAVTDAVQARGLASGCLVGTYERHDTRVRAGEAVPTAEVLRTV